MSRTSTFVFLFSLLMMLLVSPTSAKNHPNELQLTEEERILLELEKWADIEMIKYEKARGFLPIRGQATTQQHEDEVVQGQLRGGSR
jgi:hypothetical protein